jgi:hypothetical protein
VPQTCRDLATQRQAELDQATLAEAPPLTPEQGALIKPLLGR